VKVGDLAREVRDFGVISRLPRDLGVISRDLGVISRRPTNLAADLRAPRRPPAAAATAAVNSAAANTTTATTTTPVACRDATQPGRPEVRAEGQG